MKAYLECNGVQYYGYDVYAVDTPYWINTTRPYLVDDKTIERLQEMIKSLKSSSFKPAKGDEICVIPDCKYNLEDIRKNYKIKRGYDKGTCNVFSEETLGKIYSNSCLVAVLPSEKIAAFNMYNQRDKILEALRNIAPTMNEKDVVWFTQWTYVYCADFSAAYIGLLEGKNTTPNVHIDSLDLNTGEELTLDTLLIIHKLCMEESRHYASGWDENLKIQLAALNNLDWRRYPGTIDTLLNGFEWRDHDVIFQMKGHSSSYPKNVRNLLRFRSDSFASKEDQKLACRFVRTVLKIEDVEFTDIQNLAQKMVDGHVNWITFYRLFDNMVRFKDKGWKGE